MVESFVLLLRDMLADANQLPYIPALIAAIAQEDYDFLATLASDLPVQRSSGPDAHSEGLYFSAFCADESALTTAAEIEARGQTLPPAFQPLTHYALDLLADCERWD